MRIWYPILLLSCIRQIHFDYCILTTVFWLLWGNPLCPCMTRNASTTWYNGILNIVSLPAPPGINVQTIRGDRSRLLTRDLGRRFQFGPLAATSLFMPPSPSTGHIRYASFPKKNALWTMRLNQFYSPTKHRCGNNNWHIGKEAPWVIRSFARCCWQWLRPLQADRESGW